MVTASLKIQLKTLKGLFYSRIYRTNGYT